MTKIKIYDEEKIMYKIRLDYWFKSAMEFEKCIFWLSFGGIFILTNMKFDLENNLLIAIFIITLICLTITIISILLIYKLNCKYLKSLIYKDKKMEVIFEKKTNFWDSILIINFGIGILFLILLIIII